MRRVTTILCPLLVGRDEILELADQRIEEVAAGHGRMLLISGEAGIGKSRLVDAIQGKAAARGFAASGGYVAPQDRNVPAAEFLDLARNMLREPDFAELGRELLHLRDEVEEAGQDRRRRLVFDVVDRLLPSSDQPITLLFEDLQWADDLSLEIIGELARSARERPLFLIGAYRSDELGSGSLLREWHARLVTQRIAEEVRLEPLTIEQTALMTTLILNTGLPASRDVVTAVFDRTDGIPLHIEELLGALGDGTRIDGRAIRDASVPATIEDAVLARFERLSPEAQAAAQTATVIGRCFVTDVLAAIMNVPADDLDGPLRELVDQSFLLPPGARELWDFRHELLRDTLYRGIPPGRSVASMPGSPSSAPNSRALRKSTLPCTTSEPGFARRHSGRRWPERARRPPSPRTARRSSCTAGRSRTCPTTCRPATPAKSWRRTGSKASRSTSSMNRSRPSIWLAHGSSKRVGASMPPTS